MEVRERSPRELSARELATRVATAFGALFRDMQRTLAGEVGSWEREALLAWTSRGSRLADELLAFAGSQPLAPGSVEIKPMLHELARDLRCALDRQFEVVVNVSDDCPTCIADRAALRVALLALVANARDAMPGGGVISLLARPARLGNGLLAIELTVHDHGGGLVRELLETAVQPFVTTKAGRTSGLGLAAAEGFARQSGGELRLEASSSGTACRLVLPAQPARARPPSPPAPRRWR